MKTKCPNGCRYSKAMGQPYPRICIDCGYPESSALDHERNKLLETKEITLEETALVLN